MMLSLEAVFAVLFGLAFGSFLNVCILRLPRHESIVHPRSHCPHCRRPLSATDNIPLLSWIVLRGTSRCCQQPISPMYPLIEMVTAVLFVACALIFRDPVEAVGMAFFCWLILGLAVMDARTFTLPNAFTLPGIVAGIIYHAVAAWMGPGSTLKSVAASTLDCLLSALILPAVLYLVAVAYRAVRRRDGMGMGDIKLIAMISAWLGWKLGAVALFLGIMGAALAALALLFTKRESPDGKGAMRLPFGSFLGAASLCAAFAGRSLVNWYLGFF